VFRFAAESMELLRRGWHAWTRGLRPWAHQNIALQVGKPVSRLLRPLCRLSHPCEVLSMLEGKASTFQNHRKFADPDQDSAGGAPRTSPNSC